MRRQLFQAYSSLPRRPLRTRVGNIGHYSTNGPSTSSSVLLPYFVGGVGGIMAVGVGVYGYYHLSGAKKIVEKVNATKERYDNVKVVAAEKGERAREKLETMKNTAKVKAAGLRDLWAPRGSRNKGDGES